jgi:hypothetical protein
LNKRIASRFVPRGRNDYQKVEIVLVVALSQGLLQFGDIDSRFVPRGRNDYQKAEIVLGVSPSE